MAGSTEKPAPYFQALQQEVHDEIHELIEGLSQASNWIEQLHRDTQVPERIKRMIAEAHAGQQRSVTSVRKLRRLLG